MQSNAYRPFFMEYANDHVFPAQGKPEKKEEAVDTSHVRMLRGG